MPTSFLNTYRTNPAPNAVLRRFGAIVGAQVCCRAGADGGAGSTVDTPVLW